MVGVIVFGTIAAAAVGLHVTVAWLQAADVSVFIIFGLQAMEYWLFAVDVLLFARFLFGTAKRFWNQLA
jgi:hypothetical protein